MFIKFAEVNNDGGDLEAMQKRTLAARAKLLSGRAESDLSADELVLLAETYLMEGRFYHDGGHYALARETFAQAKRLINSTLVHEPTDADRILRAGMAQYWLVEATWSLREYENAMAGAKHCLDILANLDAAQFSHNMYVLKARCENLIGLSADSVGDNATARRYYERSVEAVEIIPEGERNILAMAAYGIAKSNIGRLVQKVRRYSDARSLYQEAVDAYKKLFERHPDDETVRDQYARYLQYVGETSSA